MRNALICYGGRCNGATSVKTSTTTPSDREKQEKKRKGGKKRKKRKKSYLVAQPHHFVFAVFLFLDRHSCEGSNFLFLLAVLAFQNIQRFLQLCVLGLESGWTLSVNRSINRAKKNKKSKKQENGLLTRSPSRSSWPMVNCSAIDVRSASVRDTRNAWNQSNRKKR